MKMSKIMFLKYLDFCEMLMQNLHLYNINSLKPDMK